MSELTVAMQQLPLLFFKGKVDLGEIKKAEKMLKVVFAREYVEYVHEYGFVTYHGHELTGLCQSKRLNVVNVTIEERENNPDVPHNLYVIEQTHIDDIVIWQDESGMIFQTARQGKPRKIEKSLKEYLQL